VLAKKNIPVRAILRDPDKVKDISMPQIEIVQGDFENEASLESALKGVDKAFMLMPNIKEQLDNEKRFIDVAKKTGVSHVVKLSAAGADANSPAVLKSYHGQSEEYIAQSGIAYTCVRPNFYMHNMLQSAASVVAEDKFYLPMGSGRTGVVDVQDVAEFIAEILTGSGYEGQTYDVTGPEILSFADLARQMSEVLGRQITYVDIPPGEFGAQLSKWGTSDWIVDAVGALFALIAKDEAAKMSETFEQICSKPPRSFRQFVEEHAALFSSA
jgi:uncharacterized protein YbjT (DUF2867 family)